MSKHRGSPRDKYACRVEYSEAKLGKITGIKRMFWGVVNTASVGVGYYDDGYTPDVSYLTNIRSEKLWKVKFGYMNRPVYARDPDIDKIAFPQMPCKFPLLYQDWSPSMKADLSRIMKDVVEDLKRD